MLVRIDPHNAPAPGEMVAFEVAGTPITVANVAGRFYAFDDTCTHAGCSLADGTLDDATVTCSCHGSRFDVTSGAVLNGPAEVRVGTHPVEVRGAELLLEV